MSSAFISKSINLITKEIGPLSLTEKNLILSTLKKVNSSNESQINLIISPIIQKIKMDRLTQLPVPSSDSLESSQYSSYLTLDRRHAIETYTTFTTGNYITTFTWNYSQIFSSNFPVSQKIALSLKPIKNIIQTLFHPPQLTIYPNQILSNKRIYAEIVEFSNQSYIIPNYNIRYHHTFRVLSDTTTQVLTLENQDRSVSVFEFDPILELKTITIQFHTPYTLLKFPVCKSIITITPGNPTIISCPEFSDTSVFTTGDKIYIINATNSNSTISNILNSPEGYNVLYSVPNYYINVDTTPYPADFNTPNIFFEKQLFILEFEIKCM